MAKQQTLNADGSLHHQAALCRPPLTLYLRYRRPSPPPALQKEQFSFWPPDKASNMHADKRKTQVTGQDLATARSALKGKYPRDLILHELGEWLTARAQLITSAVFVKVVADVRRRVMDPATVNDGDGSGGGGGDNEGGGQGDGGEASRRHYYRCKAILAFRCLPGSVGDALTFGMYVHEYGHDAPAAYRGNVMLECIDGTPLFNGETADERQRCLSAIAQVHQPLPTPCLPSIIVYPPPTLGVR
jgi:hypothetical protein